MRQNLDIFLLLGMGLARAFIASMDEKISPVFAILTNHEM